MTICSFGKAIVRLLTGKANLGWCSICGSKTIFVIYSPWLRDHYRCVKCHSIPRNRALIHILTTHFPEYRTYKIHESSPDGPASAKIARDCSGYIPTQYFPQIPLGSMNAGVRCENLESMKFPDETFDLVITQDVMEHVFHPDKAFAEIVRTLKPGGSHLFSVPLYPRAQTLVRAKETNGKIEHFEKPDYHGNPIDEKGSLVVREWGEDIVGYIEQHSGMKSEIHKVKDRKLGIDGEFLEILVSRKGL